MRNLPMLSVLSLACSAVDGAPTASTVPSPAVAPAPAAPPAAAPLAPPPQEPTPNPWVIPAGREKDVQGLFAPVVEGGDVIKGWKAGDVRVEAEKIDLRVVGAGGAVVVTLVHAEAPGGGAAAKSFKVRGAAEGAGAPLDAVVKRVAELVANNDRGGIWVRAADAPKAP